MADALLRQAQGARAPQTVLEGLGTQLAPTLIGAMLKKGVADKRGEFIAGLAGLEGPEVIKALIASGDAAFQKTGITAKMAAMAAAKKQETFTAVLDDNGQIIGQRSSITGEVKTDPRVKKDKDRATAKDQTGRLRYTDDGSYVFKAVGDIPRDKKLDFDQETKLRVEFTKGAGDYVKVRDAWGRIQASAKDPSAAGDLALIFNFMKVLDPGSTVREGEFRTAESASAWLQESEEAGIKIPRPIAIGIRKLATGQRLAPEQRKDFVSRGHLLYTSQLNQYQLLEDRYRGLAGLYDLNPERVVYGMGSNVAPFAAPQTTVPAKELPETKSPVPEAAAKEGVTAEWWALMSPKERALWE